MKIYTPYRQMPDKLHMRYRFKGNSVRAEVVGKPCTCSDLVKPWYAVYSYDTLIFAECDSCKRYYFNRQHYSPTTSKMQNIIRRVMIRDGIK